MAAAAKDKERRTEATIALNKRARYEYFIEEKYEAGMVLQDGEAWLIGAHFAPLKTVSTHIVADPTRTRKLLLNRSELDKLVGAVERKGHTVVPLALYWKKGNVKLEIGLAKGKQSHDKRHTEKDRDWQREKSRLMKSSR